MTKFIPAWRDREGNRIIFPYPKYVRDTELAALQVQGDSLWLLMAGLAPDGIIVADDDLTILNFEITLRHPLLAEKAVVISGPLFEAGMARQKAAGGEKIVARELEPRVS